MSKFLCCCGFYVGEEQLCMTGTEDGCVAGEIVLALDALPHGDVAVGMMGSKNQVLIYSPLSVSFIYSGV